jgi:hypothetical protein
VRLEHGLLLGLVLAIAGLGIIVGIFAQWASTGFGALGQEYLALLGLTLTGLGVQTIFGSFFLSVLGLRQSFILDESGRPTPAEERAPYAVGAPR